MEPVNESDIEWAETEQDSTRFRRKQLGDAGECEELGCSLYELPAESKSWPYHYHTANEEAIYVLSGTGAIHLEGEMQPLRAGDYVALPADESGAHRVINDSAGTLRYLVVSTMREPDVTVYPEMEKLGVFVGGAPGDSGERSLHGYYPLDGDVDYWENR